MEKDGRKEGETMALTWDTPVQELPGIGPARAARLAKLGLTAAGDLLTYYPRGYEDRRRRYTICQAPEDQAVCVAAMVAELPRLSRIRKGLELVKVRVVDGSGAMDLTFFNQAYVKDALRQGESYIFYGRAEGRGARRRMANPVFEREEKARFTGRIMPVYPLTAGISNNLLAGLTLRCVEDCAAGAAESLPLSVRREHCLAGAEFALKNIHFPADEVALESARRRLVFEELFSLTCGMASLRRCRAGAVGAAVPARSVEEFLPLLPFPPTGAQRRAMEEIMGDMASGRPMNRLIQGDVGSGKTAVAAFAAWLAAQGGYQAAMLAPTELLAEQHARTLTGLLAPAGLTVALLTGSMTAAQKREVRRRLAGGEIHLLVGTHAILSDGVGFSRLGLVITDEQHRFGVNQRSALSEKARASGALPPHVLVMSATPIPRTLALIIYGDLDVTVMDELPPGRTPVETFLVGEDKRQRMYGFVRKLAGQGRQVYIVCPAVEEQPAEEKDGGAGWWMAAEARPDPSQGLKAVVSYAGELQRNIFPDLKVSFVHGKMKPKEKEAAMAAFAAGESQVLVSTTVIEVGVDVPNAALMIVENADRFGLSQLHQLRGRVGRGKHQSYCVLMTSARNPDTRARLKALVGTTDGFKIAEEDLKLRGPGDFFGQRQHGLPQLRVADLAGDTRILKEAQDAAEALLRKDPELRLPEHALLRARVAGLFAQNPDIFN